MWAGSRWQRPEMRESTALGSTLLAGAAIGLFGWDLARPGTLAWVNTARSTHFLPRLGRNVVRLGGVCCALLTAHAGG